MRILARAWRLLPVATCAWLGVASAAAAQTMPSPDVSSSAVSLPNTEVRSLHSTLTGRDYDLYVQLPAGYARDTGKTYPVLYVLDGQWDFKLLSSIQGGLLYDRYVPEMIIVGITYHGANAKYDSLRALDLTPTADANRPGTGDGPKFLAFLRTEVFPLVARQYRADPAPSRRVLLGSSLGGLFTLYTLFTEPGLFGGYIAASPAVTYGNRSSFAQEAAYAAAHRDLPARLYLAVGDQEPLATPVREFMEIVRGRGYRGLALETRMVEGERHSGNKPEAFNRGLRFVFPAP